MSDKPFGQTDRGHIVPAPMHRASPLVRAALATIFLLALSSCDTSTADVTVLHCKSAPGDALGQSPRFDAQHRCKNGFDDVGHIRLTINPATNTVLVEGNGSRSFLENCKIADTANWKCKSTRQVLGAEWVSTQGMIDGRYYSTLTGAGPPDIYQSSLTGIAGTLYRLGLLTAERAFTLDRRLSS